jgi:DNA-binding HxlR family transcriptional regulator
MRGYRQYCPIARGAEIFAERWTPIVVRNLLVGCDTFGQILAGAPGLPRSVLSQRLRSLEQVGVLERRRAGHRTSYHLTPAGEELAEVCHVLGVWGARWLETAPGDLDAHLALWFWSRLVDRDQLPASPVVVRFDLTDGSRPGRFWVVLARSGSEVCVKPPGPDTDLVVTTDTRSLIAWHSGRLSLRTAQRERLLRIEGPPGLVRAFPRWGGLSPFAQVAPAAAGGTGRG